MILNNTPENQAILTNVSGTNEFRIRNSSKAFSILSSGLYANKIKAIIRELSCNAYDSHIAAGKKDVPFDIHLPNRIEPWFSIRDYGTGLDADQVKTIYTTYFESTKTHSNDFVGALGLGSKSPFSYTENFSVTTVKDGMCWIFSAFVNEQGIPSIALMNSFESTEPNGVEIKFAVDNKEDFYKFESEAANVFVWFDVVPDVSGCSTFVAALDSARRRDRSIQFNEKDIIPGVHVLSNPYVTSNIKCSFALMGNICYPIEVPNAKTNLGDLHTLLDCNLLIEFNIGEIDFQASREGLSYNSLTITSIKNKLQKLSDSLYEKFKIKIAEHESNVWNTAKFLVSISSHNIWMSSAIKYLTDNPNPLCKIGSTYYNRGVIYYDQSPSVDFQKANDLNINIRVFEKRYGKIKYPRFYNNIIVVSPTGANQFFVNDTNVGALERCKRHVLDSSSFKEGIFFVLEKIDKTKEMDLDSFFDILHNPPKEWIQSVSSLNELPKRTRNRDVTVLKLVEGRKSYYKDNFTWTDVGSLSNINDSSKKFYYIPVSGFTAISEYVSDFKLIYSLMKRTNVFKDCSTIYGIRKADMENIKNNSNWINIEDHIISILESNKEVMKNTYLYLKFDGATKLQYNKNICEKLSDDSQFKIVSKTISKLNVNDSGSHSLIDLCMTYSNTIYTEIVEDAKIKIQEIKSVLELYPMLLYVNTSTQYEGYVDNKDLIRFQAIADYINLIDKQKKELSCSLT
jgi:hypothetical protein